MAIPQLQELIETIQMGRQRFLYGLERVPEERLRWSPRDAAKTPLELAGRCAGFLDVNAYLLQNRSMPEASGGLPPPPASLDAARAALGSSFARLEETIERLTEADLGQPVPAPWGETVPVLRWLWFIPSVIGYFQGQLNYVQLAYGDEEPNIPPEWGRQ
jgi:DinB family protein